jgi:cell division septation protein DedD
MEETPLLHKPSIDDQIINALKGFSIVESVIKIRNNLVITVYNEQWVKLATVQKDKFAKTVHGFVNANVTVEDIYIKNKQGENLAYLQKGETGNNYMVLAEKVTEKLETEKAPEAPFDLEKALSTEATDLQNRAAVSAEGVDESANDIIATIEITLKAWAPEPTPQPVVHQNPKYRALYKILIVFLVVIIAGAAGYYFSFIKEEPEQAKRSFDLFKKIAPLRIPETQIDKKNQALKLTVQTQKAADDRKIEAGKKAASQPMAEKTSLPASQMTATPVHKQGASSPAIKENKPAEPTPATASIKEKPAQPPAEEKKVIAPHQKKAAVNALQYCVNVSLCKLKESADVVIKDLQKKGYEPAVDTITVKDTPWYRVTLGHFQTQGEAENYARELQSRENIKGFVVKKK